MTNFNLVVCEKPFTPTSEEANDLVTLAQQRNRLLAVYQSTLDQTKFSRRIHFQELTSRLTDRRFDADFVTLTKLVKNGSLGRVVEFETHFDRHRPEEPPADVSKSTFSFNFSGALGLDSSWVASIFPSALQDAIDYYHKFTNWMVSAWIITVVSTVLVLLAGLTAFGSRWGSLITSFCAVVTTALFPLTESKRRLTH